MCVCVGQYLDSLDTSADHQTLHTLSHASQRCWVVYFDNFSSITHWSPKRPENLQVNEWTQQS